jgi:hypothetical protein
MPKGVRPLIRLEQCQRVPLRGRVLREKSSTLVAEWGGLRTLAAGYTAAPVVAPRRGRPTQADRVPRDPRVRCPPHSATCWSPFSASCQRSLARQSYRTGAAAGHIQPVINKRAGRYPALSPAGAAFATTPSSNARTAAISSGFTVWLIPW